MMLQRIGKLLAVLTLAFGQPVAADLTATVDQTVITDLDLITLTVRASDESADAEPDFSAIGRDFNVVSQTSRQNSSLSIINGQTTSTTYKDHILVLSPKRLGNLTIPAVQAGGAVTRPISVRVQQQSPTEQQRMRQFVFFDTEVDTNETYVQGQIIYTVRLFYTEAIGGDFPQAPAPEQAVIETLEAERRYESIVGGRRYYVLEKRYAIFPQRSGTLVIPRERFIGTRGRGGVFAQRQRVNAVSESHTINVKTIPAGFTGNHWIPARALSISESWKESPPVFRVGEPVNRTLTLAAVGLTDSLLPRLDETPVENAKIYADPPVTESRAGPDGITALQTTTLGVVPTREGEITLPEISIPWWNTQTDRQEMATIAAATYPVLPAPGEAVTVPSLPVPQFTEGAQAPPAAPAYWQWAALVLGALWLLSTWQWLALRRQVRVLESASMARYEAPAFDDPDETREFRLLKEACNQNRAADAHRQLFLWAKARYPEISSIIDLARRFPELAADITRLEAHLYGAGEPASWQGGDLLGRVTGIRQTRVQKPGARALEAALNPA